MDEFKSNDKFKYKGNIGFIVVIQFGDSLPERDQKVIIDGNKYVVLEVSRGDRGDFGPSPNVWLIVKTGD